MDEEEIVNNVKWMETSASDRRIAGKVKDDRDLLWQFTVSQLHLPLFKAIQRKKTEGLGVD